MRPSAAGGKGDKRSGAALVAGPCVLPALAEPRLFGVLPGLAAAPGGFELSAGAFACCEGSGLRPCQGGARASCDLRARMRALSALATRYEKSCCVGEGRPAWPGPAFDPDPRFLHVVLERLQALKAGHSHKGIMYRLPAQSPGRFSLWSVAFAAVWRFGFDVKIIRLGAADALRAMTAGAPAASASPPAPTLVLVDGAAKLWDARHADAFELAVGFAHRAGFPLWVAWEGSAEPESAAQTRPGGSHVRRALAARLARIKRRSLLDWLAADTRSKLLELCEPVRAQPETPAPSSRTSAARRGQAR
jgi:hypothetical protein